MATLAVTGSLAAQGKVHRLEATPDTVAYGYYDAAAKPVLRIASGDIIDVDTLLTSTPDRLEKVGVAPADIQQSLRDIVSTVKNRGPGGHILTGPVFVDGAEPGDALEVRVISIDLVIPYGYNGQAAADRAQGDDAEVAARRDADALHQSMGTDEDLTKATKIAIQEMIDFIAAKLSVDRQTAYQLTSVACDVAITQLVDGKVGVHVKLPKNIFRVR